MKIELKPRATMSFDINVKELYEFCVKKQYIDEDIYLKISMYEILCEFLGIYEYVEDYDSKNIEDELRSMLLDMAYKDKYDDWQELDDDFTMEEAPR
jgi:hypothetical protein